jgi:hypothetical protein
LSVSQTDIEAASTSGVEVLQSASRSLAEPEQDELIERLVDDQTRRHSTGESLAAQMLRSLLTVAILQAS